MNLEILKLQKIAVPEKYQKKEGCVAFQKIKVIINFYGGIIENVLDTKILEDGRQIVKDWNGFI